MADRTRTVARTRAYFGSLTGAGWNRFWFTPVDPLPVSMLRILTGLLAVLYLAGYCLELGLWFGQDGLLPSDLVHRLTGAFVARETGDFIVRPTYLHWAGDPFLLWTFHLAALAAAVSFTIGFASRIANVATLVGVLAIVHRAPMITGQFEPVLALLLFYLCLAPTGAAWSVDAWRRARGKTTAPSGPSWSANVALRLIQTHVAALYFMMGVTKLAGTPWWSGEAVWWLIAHSESRLIDLTFLHQFPYAFNALTHLIVFVELGFPILVIRPWSRPAVLLVSPLLWILIGLLTGLLSFAAIMIVANLAFVSPAAIRDVAGDLSRRGATGNDLGGVGDATPTV